MEWNAIDTPPLQDTQVRLRTYTGDHLQVLGSIEVGVVYKKQSYTLPLLVVAGNGPGSGLAGKHPVGLE